MQIKSSLFRQGSKPRDLVMYRDCGTQHSKIKDNGTFVRLKQERICLTIFASGVQKRLPGPILDTIWQAVVKISLTIVNLLFDVQL